MSKSSRTSYEQRFWEMNDSKSWLDQKLGQKTKYLYYPVGRGNNQTTIAKRFFYLIVNDCER